MNPTPDLSPQEALTTAKALDPVPEPRPWVAAPIRSRGRMGTKPPEPARAPAEHRRPIKGWHPAPWELRCVLLAASQRLPRGTGLQALLEGVERYVKLTGKGRHGPGPGPAESVAWWADVMAMVDCVGRVADSGTRLLLAPWLGRRDGPEGFRPFGT